MPDMQQNMMNDRLYSPLSYFILRQNPIIFSKNTCKGKSFFWSVRTSFFAYKNKSIVILQRCVQFSSVAQSCSTFCDTVIRSTPGLPVHHQLPDFTQTHVRRVDDAIQPSHPLLSPSPPPNPSQHQSLCSSFQIE